MTRAAPLALYFAMSLTLAACAARGGVPRPFPGGPAPPTDAPPAPSTVEPTTLEPGILTSAVVSTALTLRGIAYRNAGSSPSEGFDCSGLVQWVFAQHGAPLPREVSEQFRVGHKVDEDEIRAGDLVFFETVSRGPSHVGIALGDGTFVHAPSSRGVVRVESYATEYWAKRWIGARRIEMNDEGQTK